MSGDICSCSITNILIPVIRVEKKFLLIYFTILLSFIPPQHSFLFLTNNKQSSSSSPSQSSVMVSESSTDYHSTKQFPDTIFHEMEKNWINEKKRREVPNSVEKVELEEPVTHYESLIYQRILQKNNYWKKMRPKGTVEVNFSMNLNSIVSMEEREQIIVLHAFIDQIWVDQRLSWNPSNFDDISVMRIPVDLIWTPDTFMYNTADENGFLTPVRPIHAVVQSNGTVFWGNPMAKMRSRCRMTIDLFPYDTQTCSVMFGSWSHSTRFINYSLTNLRPDFSLLSANNEWDIIDVVQERIERFYDAFIEPANFSEITYHITIRRKPLHVIYNTVVPACMLTTLTLVSFFIPFAQETQIGISIMLAYAVSSLRMAEEVPAQSESVPLISIYLTLCMGFSLVAMIWFSIMNKLREMKRLPACLQTLVLHHFARLTCAQDVVIRLQRAMHAQQQLSIAEEQAAAARRTWCSAMNQVVRMASASKNFSTLNKDHKKPTLTDTIKQVLSQQEMKNHNDVYQQRMRANELTPKHTDSKAQNETSFSHKDDENLLVCSKNRKVSLAESTRSSTTSPISCNSSSTSSSSTTSSAFSLTHSSYWNTYNASKNEPKSFHNWPTPTLKAKRKSSHIWLKISEREKNRLEIKERKNSKKSNSCSSTSLKRNPHTNRSTNISNRSTDTSINRKCSSIDNLSKQRNHSRERRSPPQNHSSRYHLHKSHSGINQYCPQNQSNSKDRQQQHRSISKNSGNHNNNNNNNNSGGDGDIDKQLHNHQHRHKHNKVKARTRLPQPKDSHHHHHHNRQYNPYSNHMKQYTYEPFNHQESYLYHSKPDYNNKHLNRQFFTSINSPFYESHMVNGAHSMEREMHSLDIRGMNNCNNSIYDIDEYCLLGTRQHDLKKHIKLLKFRQAMLLSMSKPNKTLIKRNNRRLHECYLLYKVNRHRLKHFQSKCKRCENQYYYSNKKDIHDHNVTGITAVEQNCIKIDKQQQQQSPYISHYDIDPTTTSSQQQVVCSPKPIHHHYDNHQHHHVNENILSPPEQQRLINRDELNPSTQDDHVEDLDEKKKARTMTKKRQNKKSLSSAYFHDNHYDNEHNMHRRPDDDSDQIPNAIGNQEEDEYMSRYPYTHSSKYTLANVQTQRLIDKQVMLAIAILNRCVFWLFISFILLLNLALWIGIPLYMSKTQPALALPVT
ncbi:hypothetical protein SNEBB_006676 [Seison nebaliae]|nr:hypothetical protein SNEBB_006676 [Seison nebaliae]